MSDIELNDVKQADVVLNVGEAKDAAAFDEKVYKQGCLPTWLKFPLFGFPDAVNEFEMRFSAFLIAAALFAVIATKSDLRVLAAFAAAEFLVAFVAGPRATVHGALSAIVTDFFPKEYVRGAPFQFGYFINAIPVVIAAVLYYDSDETDQRTAAAIVIGVVAAYYVLSILRVFLWNKFFEFMTNNGIVTDEWRNAAELPISEAKIKADREDSREFGFNNKTIWKRTRGTAEEPCAFAFAADHPFTRDEQFSLVRHVNIHHSLLPFALAAISLMWYVGQESMSSPPAVWQMIALLSVFTAIPLTVYAILKLFRFPCAVYREWQNLYNRPFYVSAFATLALWGLLLEAYSAGTGQGVQDVLYYTSVIGIFIVVFLSLAESIRNYHYIDVFTPNWLIVPISTILVGMLIELNENLWIANTENGVTIIGLAAAAVLTPLVVFRLVFRESLPDKYRQAVPLLVGLVATIHAGLTNVIGSFFQPGTFMNALADGFAYFSIVLVLAFIWLTFMGYFFRGPFHIQWLLYPISACLVGMQMAFWKAMDDTYSRYWLTAAMFYFTTVVAATMGLHFLNSVFQRRAFTPPVDEGPLAVIRGSINEALRNYWADMMRVIGGLVITIQGDTSAQRAVDSDSLRHWMQQKGYIFDRCVYYVDRRATVIQFTEEHKDDCAAAHEALLVRHAKDNLVITRSGSLTGEAAQSFAQKLQSFRDVFTPWVERVRPATSNKTIEAWFPSERRSVINGTNVTAQSITPLTETLNQLSASLAPGSNDYAQAAALAETFNAQLTRFLSDDDRNVVVPIRKLIPFSIQRSVVRSQFELVAFVRNFDETEHGAAPVEFVEWMFSLVLTFLRTHEERVAFLKAWTWSYPGQSQLIGRITRDVVSDNEWQRLDDAEWDRIQTDVPQLAPRYVQGYQRLF